MPGACFTVIASADPQALIRVLNHFAQIGLLPGSVKAVESGGLVTIRIEQSDLDEQQADIIAEKMRSSVLIEAVHVRRSRRLISPRKTIYDIST